MSDPRLQGVCGNLYTVATPEYNACNVENGKVDTFLKAVPGDQNVEAILDSNGADADGNYISDKTDQLMALVQAEMAAAPQPAAALQPPPPPPAAARPQPAPPLRPPVYPGYSGALPSFLSPPARDRSLVTTEEQPPPPTGTSRERCGSGFSSLSSLAGEGCTYAGIRLGIGLGLTIGQYGEFKDGEADGGFKPISYGGFWRGTDEWAFGGGMLMVQGYKSFWTWENLGDVNGLNLRLGLVGKVLWSKYEVGVVDEEVTKEVTIGPNGEKISEDRFNLPHGSQTRIYGALEGELQFLKGISAYVQFGGGVYILSLEEDKETDELIQGMPTGHIGTPFGADELSSTHPSLYFELGLNFRIIDYLGINLMIWGQPIDLVRYKTTDENNRKVEIKEFDSPNLIPGLGIFGEF